MAAREKAQNVNISNVSTPKANTPKANTPSSASSASTPINKLAQVFTSTSSDITADIAEELAYTASPGDIICLVGPLGAGKTVFAQGFARGLGYTGRVTSPTFTIMQIYEGGRLPIYHFDLYRLEGGVEDLEGIGYEDYFYAGGVCLIEWPQMAKDAMPKTAKWVEIQADFDKDLEFRRIVIS